MGAFVDIAMLIMKAGLTKSPIMIPPVLRAKKGKILKIAKECFAVPEKPDSYDVSCSNYATCDTVVLVSGGMDSTIAYQKAKNNSMRAICLYVDFGQIYANKEISALDALGIDAEIVDLKHLTKDVKEGSWKHIIPARNLLLLSIAAERLSGNGTIWLAAVNGEMPKAGGDKSEKFFHLFAMLMRSITGQMLHLNTLGEGTKADWVKWWIEQGLDIKRLRKTVTCFDSIPGHCGQCQACLRRYIAFEHNGIDTVADYKKHPMIGGAEYVEKYRTLMAKALAENDFSRYSQRRCTQTLDVLNK